MAEKIWPYVYVTSIEYDILKYVSDNPHLIHKPIIFSDGDGVMFIYSNTKLNIYDIVANNVGLP